jgi:hypothetical protein
MTDKELLELAAKAAEIKIRWSADSLGNQTGPWIFNSRWNPLTDDGDALRLAVKLRLTPHIDGNLTDCEDCTVAHLDDPYAATRRAITRAAAEIGKAAP